MAEVDSTGGRPPMQKITERSERTEGQTDMQADENDEEIELDDDMLAELVAAEGGELDEEDMDEDECERLAALEEEEEAAKEGASLVSSPNHDNDASSTSSSGVGSSPNSQSAPSPTSETAGHGSSPSTGLSGSPSSSHSLTVALPSTGHSPRSHHPPEKKHICDMCGKAFPYLSILESHKRCHTGEKPFTCHYCDKKFAQKATLQVHERTHTGERPYKCRYCEKTFAQYGTKTVHEKSAHLGIRNYKCPKCDKCLSSPSALYTHKKTHGEKVFSCDFCPKTFTLKNYLKLHVKQVHEQTERKHSCTYCNKSFAYAGSLQVHIRTHTGERPYTCRYCPKAFASQGNLQSHERTHTGERPYTCDVCARSFIQKSQLTAHEATHTGGVPLEECQRRPSLSLPAPTALMPPTVMLPGLATPVPLPGQGTVEKPGDHACQVCGKRYAFASSLYVHARQHTGERPFKCTYCEKTFTNQGNMQVHLRVHTGEKPFKCSGCDKCYAQKVGLKIHHEQCQAYLSSSATSSTSSNARGSTSPLNVETSSDDDSGRNSGGEENIMLVEGRKMCLDSLAQQTTSLAMPASNPPQPIYTGPMHNNIYAPPLASSQPSCFTPTTPTSSMPFTLTQLQSLSSQWTPKMADPLPPSLSSLGHGAMSLSDYGPLTASKPPFSMGQGDMNSLSDSISSAFAPVQNHTDALIKSLLESSQGSLLTNLLLQQLQSPLSSSLPPHPPPLSSSSSTLDLLALLASSSSSLIPPSPTALLPAPTPIMPTLTSPTSTTFSGSNLSALLHSSGLQ